MICNVILLIILLLCNTSLSFRMSMNASGYQYLRDKDQNAYLNTILRRSTIATKQGIVDNCKLMEIEFIPDRKNDISVTETLDITRDFALEYLNAFKEYGNDCWVIFPDGNELTLARKKWGAIPFTMTSIEGAIKQQQQQQPKIGIALTPGFNIEEWIELAKWDINTPLIIINGNLNRLKEGYYPSFFYPGLAKVSNSFYKNAVQIFSLQPISVSGDRFGGYISRSYPDNFETLLKTEYSYEVIKSTKQQDTAKTTYDIVKLAYKEKYNKLF